MTYLFLIRHGENDANLQRPYILQGQGIDGPLSTLGRQQASACSAFLSDFPLCHIYASPMRRAQESAAVIAEPHGLSVKTAATINECNVGRWEGMDWGRIELEFPDDYSRFRANPVEHGYLDGESYADVADRVLPVMNGLLQEHRGESIAVVAHNVVNRVYLASLLNIPLVHAPMIRQANCGINVIRHTPDETVVTTMNSAFHLDGLMV